MMSKMKPCQTKDIQIFRTIYDIQSGSTNKNHLIYMKLQVCLNTQRMKLNLQISVCTPFFGFIEDSLQ